MGDVTALFELHFDGNDVSIVQERYYKLEPAADISDSDLDVYGRGGVSAACATGSDGLNPASTWAITAFEPNARTASSGFAVMNSAAAFIAARVMYRRRSFFSQIEWVLSSKTPRWRSICDTC